MPKKEIFVITGTEVENTGMVSFKFMFDSKGPFKTFGRYADTYGCLHLRPKGPYEIDIEKFSARQLDCVGDDGVKKWEFFIFKGSLQIFTGSVNENLNEETEEELKRLIELLPECVLLMSQDLFDRFKKACDSIPDITLGVHHYEGKLATR